MLHNVILYQTAEGTYDNNGRLVDTANGNFWFSDEYTILDEETAKELKEKGIIRVLLTDLSLIQLHHSGEYRIYKKDAYKPLIPLQIIRKLAEKTQKIEKIKNIDKEEQK